MKAIKFYSFILGLLLLQLWSPSVHAQVGLKLGTGPDFGKKTASAVLDLGTGNQGLLLPKVELQSKTLSAPLTGASFALAAPAGMFIYNTATVGNVTPGIYYSDGTSWQRCDTGAANGLTKSGDNIELGGTLSKSTTIDLGTNNFVLKPSTASGMTFNAGNTNTNNRIFMSTAGLEIQSNESSTAILKIMSSTSEKVSFMPTGRVGIGVTAPETPLHVYSSASTGIAKLEAGTTSTTSTSTLPVLSAVASMPSAAGTIPNGFGPEFTFSTQIGTSAEKTLTKISSIRDGGTEPFPTGSLVFSTNTANSITSPTASAITERMRVDGTSGNVGIGTNAPSQKLHVVGGALISGLAGTGSRMVVADASGLLSTQAIPTGTGTVTSVSGGTGITIGGTATAPSVGLANMAALSVKGNATNAAAAPTDIAAGTDGFVLRRSGTALGFGTVATPGIADDAVTYTKIQNVSTNNRLLGRATTGAGTVEEITLGSGLSLSGTTLSSTAYTASNGLTMSSSNVKLGGTLTENTTITQNTFNFILKPSTASGMTFAAGNNPANNRIYMPTDGLEIQSNETSVLSKPILQVRNSGSEKFRIQSDGQVGIGTSAPTNLLHLNGGAEGVETVLLNLQANAGGSTEPGTGVTIRFSPTNPAGFNARGAEIAGINQGANAIDMIFRTTSATSNFMERMRIMSSGEVSIGTTTPSSMLHVNGTIAVATGNTIENSIILSSININLPSAASSSGRIYIIRNTNASASITVSSIVNYTATASAPYILLATEGAITVVSNGLNWYRVQ